jgi:hypothetical protein
VKNTEIRSVTESNTSAPGEQLFNRWFEGQHPALFQERKEEFLFGLRNTAPNTPSKRNPTPDDFVFLLRSE